MENREPGIHFGWVAVLAIAGVVVTSLAFLATFVPGLGANAVSVWQSILTNFGVGVFSAAALLLFEPKLRGAISKTVSTTVTEQVKKDVREAVQADIEERFSSLEDAISSRYDEMLARQQGLTKDLVANFTHDRVIELLREASNLSAVYSRGITVHGDATPGDFLSVGIRLGPPQGYRPFGYDSVDPEQYVLHVSVSPKEGNGWAEVTWDSEQDFADVAEALAYELNSRLIRGIGEKIDWGPILRRLEKALDVALNASMKTAGSLPIKGQVIDFVEGDQDWYLTVDGLYCPEIPYHLPGNHFNQKATRKGSPSPTKTEVPRLEKPDQVKSESEWRYVFELARRHFTPSSYQNFRM